MPYPEMRSRRTQKREEAEARQAARAQRTDSEQLAALVARGAEFCEEANQLRARLGMVAIHPMS